MLIPLERLLDKYELNITGILHIGAHHGEELESYEQLEVPRVVWIEGNPEACKVLEKHVEGLDHHKVIRALVDDSSHLVKFHVANNGQSSSVLELGTHTKHHPEVHYVSESSIMTTTVDALFEFQKFTLLNFWNLDVQGLELRVLQGGVKALNGCDYIYTEVNDEEVYVGAALVGQIDEFLSDFKRVETEWTRHKWGDAFYVRKGLL